MLCISIAFVFWLFTKLSYPYRSRQTFELRYQIPPHLSLAQSPPQEVQVLIEAAGWDLLQLCWQRRQRRININLHNSPNSEQRLNLAPSIAEQLPFARLLNLQPEYLDLQLEDTLSKELPIFLDNQLQIAKDYLILGPVQTNPSSVRVFGPQTAVQNLRACTLELQQPETLNRSLRWQQNLKPHPNINLQYQPQNIECYARIEQVTEKKLEIPLQIRNLPPDLPFLLLTTKIELTCLVSLRRYDQLQADAFQAEVDFQDFDLLQHRNIRIKLSKIPDFAYQIHFYPKTAEYIIRSNN